MLESCIFAINVVFNVVVVMMIAVAVTSTKTSH
jgi:hypothetical protein